MRLKDHAELIILGVSIGMLLMLAVVMMWPDAFGLTRACQTEICI